MEPKERTAARRLNIYKHLARRVGRTSSSDPQHELAYQIARFCHDTDNRATPIDGYHVWCEINGIQAKSVSLGSLFKSDDPSPDKKLRELYVVIELEEYRLMRHREEHLRKKEQKKLKEYLAHRKEDE